MRGLSVVFVVLLFLHHNHARSMRQAWARTFYVRFGCDGTFFSSPQPCPFNGTGMGSNLLCGVWVWWYFFFFTTTMPVQWDRHGLGPSMGGLSVDFAISQPSLLDATGLDSNLQCGVRVWCFFLFSPQPFARSMWRVWAQTSNVRLECGLRSIP
jgi:hypothetical protein